MGWPYPRTTDLTFVLAELSEELLILIKGVRATQLTLSETVSKE